MNSGLLEYIEIKPGTIRIKPSIEGIITQDRYIEIARNLLKNGIISKDETKLKYDNSVDFTDNMLLYNEIEKQNRKEVKEVVFSLYGTDYKLNSQNIDTIAKPIKEEIFGSNDEAIKVAIEEMFQR